MFEPSDVTPYNARDILAAVPDGVSLALGVAVRSPHPFADLVAESPLRAAACAAGQIMTPRSAGEADAAVIGRGLRTLNFGNAIAAALQAAARRKFDQQAQHLGAVSLVEVKRIGEPEPTGAVDMAVAFEDVTRGNEYKQTPAALQDGEQITLSSFGRLVMVSRENVFNDDLDLIRDAIAETGTAAARMESRMVAAALDAHGNLSDGNPVFDAAYKNTCNATGTINSAELAAAMAQLRLQPAADGMPLDAAAAGIIVPPLIEYDALELIHLAGLPIQVYCLPGLLDTLAYYVICSPDVARSIAVARLAGQTHPLVVEPVKSSLKFDGAAVRVRVDTGAAMIGRRGIVYCV